MRVLFVVEAGRTHGLGHLLRCRALMIELTAHDALVDLIVKGDKGTLDGRSWATQIAASTIPDRAGVDGVVAEALDVLTRVQYDWVIIVGYSFSGTQLYRAMTERGSRLLFVDDVADRAIKADILLNSSAKCAAIYRRNGTKARVFLLGPRYAAIEREYREARTTRQPAGPLRRVLISFGGTDRGSWTRRVLAALAGLPCELDIDVVIGPFGRWNDSAAPAAGPHRVHMRHAPTTLAPLMRQADLMVSAAGSTIWQACCVGLPSIALETASNQKEVLRTLTDAGAALTGRAETIFEWEDSGICHFRALLDQAIDPGVREALSSRAWSLVDGLGATRVASAMRDFCA